MKARRVEIAVEADEVGLRQQLVLGQHLDAGLRQKFSRHLDDVIAQHAHPDRQRPAHHRLANVAHADDAERRFCECLAGRLLPQAGAHVSIHPW
jgi:hypothetical protein